MTSAPARSHWTGPTAAASPCKWPGRPGVRTSLLGRHQVYSVLAAVATALAEGFDLDKTLARLAALTPMSGRLELVPLPSGALCCATISRARPETIEAALELLAQVPAMRRIVVLGEVDELPGSQGPVYRHLGELVGATATSVVFVCGRKQFQSYSVGARRAGLAKESIVRAETDPLVVAELLPSDLGPGDVVLVKGRATERLGRVALGRWPAARSVAPSRTAE